jgi:hypothetical protein
MDLSSEEDIRNAKSETNVRSMSLEQRKLSSTYMAEVEHVLGEVLNIEMNHNLKLSESLPITIREKELGLIVIQSKVVAGQFFVL